MTVSTKNLPTTVGHALVGLGLVAVVLGILWNRLVPAEVFWSERQAERYNQAYAAAHDASAGHSHSESPQEGRPRPPAIDLSTARRAFDNAERELAQARRARDRGGRWLSIVGAASAIAGLLLLRGGRR